MWGMIYRAGLRLTKPQIFNAMRFISQPQPQRSITSSFAKSMRPLQRPMSTTTKERLGKLREDFDRRHHGEYDLKGLSITNSSQFRSFLDYARTLGQLAQFFSIVDRSQLTRLDSVMANAIRLRLNSIKYIIYQVYPTHSREYPRKHPECHRLIMNVLTQDLRIFSLLQHLSDLNLLLDIDPEIGKELIKKLDLSDLGRLCSSADQYLRLDDKVLSIIKEQIYDDGLKHLAGSCVKTVDDLVKLVRAGCNPSLEEAQKNALVPDAQSCIALFNRLPNKTGIEKALGTNFLVQLYNQANKEDKDLLVNHPGCEALRFYLEDKTKYDRQGEDLAKQLGIDPNAVIDSEQPTISPAPGC